MICGKQVLSCSCLSSFPRPIMEDRRSAPGQGSVGGRERAVWMGLLALALAMPYAQYAHLQLQHPTTTATTTTHGTCAERSQSPDKRDTAAASPEPASAPTFSYVLDLPETIDQPPTAADGSPLPKLGLMRMEWQTPIYHVSLRGLRNGVDGFNKVGI